jgi:CarD family transcriptional regulator
MEFSVGDKVVHPYHGPGEVVSVERKELAEEAKRYLVIDIPVRELTVYVPWQKADNLGVRLAMSSAKRSRMMDTLRAEPRILPNDYKDRQEQVWEQLKTGLAISIAEVVRDLTWHEAREHLTKKDTDYLNRAKMLLAAELALVSDMDHEDAEETIEHVLEECVVVEDEED